ncbi:hypothetical protein [Lacunimicrobium album]
MSKFKCQCGHIISDIVSPNEVTGWLLSDKSGERFFTEIAELVNGYFQHLASNDLDAWRRQYFTADYPNDLSAGDEIHDALRSRFVDLTLSLMECDQCGRVWIQSKPDVNHYHAFMPEDEHDKGMKVLGYNHATLPPESV